MSERALAAQKSVQWHCENSMYCGHVQCKFAISLIRYIINSLQDFDCGHLFVSGKNRFAKRTDIDNATDATNNDSRVGAFIGRQRRHRDRRNI